MKSAPPPLLSAIHDRRLVVFVGEGLDGPRQAAAELRRQILADPHIPPTTGPLADAMLLYEAAYGPQALRRLVRTVYLPLEPGDSLARLFAQLSPRAIIALTIGDWAGRALEQCGQRPERFVPPEAKPYRDQGRPWLYQLYGSLDQEETLRLGDEQRRDLARTPLFHALKEAMADATRLIVGRVPDDRVFPALYRELVHDPAHAPPTFVIGAELDPAVEVLWRPLVTQHLGDDLPAILELLRPAPQASPPRRTARLAAAPGYQRARPPQIYKDLNHYDSEDADRFFGRDYEIDRIVPHIKTNHVTILIGKSGAGKTSLLRAGIAPRLSLAEPPYVPIYLRPVARPVATLRRELGQLVPGASPEAPIVELLLSLRREGRQAVLLLDQFEELFAAATAQERDEFVALLRELMPQNVPARLVFAIRADRLADLTTLLSDELYSHWVQPLTLLPLTLEQAREVIEEPAAAVGVSFEPALVERIIDDLSQEHAASTEGDGLGAERRIEPPQIQLACSALYGALDEDERIIGGALYERLGGARGILRRYLASSLDRLGPRRSLAERILHELVGTGQSRLPQRADYLAATLGQPEESIVETLERLMSARLVRELPVERGLGYELAHEYLIGELRLSEGDKERKYHEKLIRDRCEQFQRYGTIMDYDSFQVVTRSSQDARLLPEHAEFMLRSAIVLQSDVAAWASRLAEWPERLQSVAREWLLPEDPLESQHTSAELSSLPSLPSFEDLLDEGRRVSPEQYGREQAAALEALDLAPPADYEALLITALRQSASIHLRDTVIVRLALRPSEAIVPAIRAALRAADLPAADRAADRPSRHHLVRKRLDQPTVNLVIALARLDQPAADEALIDYYESLFGTATASLRRGLIQALVNEFGQQDLPSGTERLLILAAVNDSDADVRLAADSGLILIRQPANVALLFDLAVPVAENYALALRELEAIEGKAQVRMLRQSGYDPLPISLQAWVLVRSLAVASYQLHFDRQATRHNRAFELLFSTGNRYVDQPSRQLLLRLEHELAASPRPAERLLGKLGLVPAFAVLGLILGSMLPGWLKPSGQALNLILELLFRTIPLTLLLVCLLLQLILAQSGPRPRFAALRERLLARPWLGDYLWAQRYLLSTYALIVGLFMFLGCLPSTWRGVAGFLVGLIGLIAGFGGLFPAAIYFGVFSGAVFFYWLVPGRRRNDGSFFVAGPDSARWYTTMALLRRYDRDDLALALLEEDSAEHAVESISGNAIPTPQLLSERQGGSSRPALPLVAAATLGRWFPRRRTLLGRPPAENQFNSVTREELLEIAAIHSQGLVTTAEGRRAQQRIDQYRAGLAASPPRPRRASRLWRAAAWSLVLAVVALVALLSVVSWVNRSPNDLPTVALIPDQNGGTMALIVPGGAAPLLLEGAGQAPRPAPEFAGAMQLTCVDERCVVAGYGPPVGAGPAGGPGIAEAAGGPGAQIGVVEAAGVRWLSRPAPNSWLPYFWLADAGDGQPLIWVLDLSLASSGSGSLKVAPLDTGVWKEAPRFAGRDVNSLTAIDRRTALISLPEPDPELPSELAQWRTYITHDGGATWGLVAASTGSRSWSREGDVLVAPSQLFGLQLTVTKTRLALARGGRDARPVVVLERMLRPGDAECGASFGDLTPTTHGLYTALSLRYALPDGEQGVYVSIDDGLAWSRVPLKVGDRSSFFYRYFHRCSSDSMLSLIPEPIKRMLTDES